MTPEEKLLIQGELSRFPGAGNDVIERELNTDGSALVEAWVTIPVNEQRIKIHNAVLLSTFYAADKFSLRKLRAFLASSQTDEDAADVKMLYESTDTFDVNDPVFESMLTMLVGLLSLPVDVVTNILRLGQRKLSRAEELIGRKITLEEAQEALNG